MVEPIAMRLAIAYASAPVWTLDGRPAGADWYANARHTVRRMAREYSVTEATAAGVIAAYSPRTQWAENLKRAREAFGGRVRGLPFHRKHARQILEGMRPLDSFRAPGVDAPKVCAFYRNLMGDLTPVTVDVWAARAAGVDEKSFDYETVAAGYVRAAELCEVAPAELQAVVWVNLRGAEG